MSSENIHQVFVVNPITTNLTSDLLYFGRSPYSSSDDAAMLFSDFAAQFVLAGTEVTPAQVQSNAFNTGTDTGTTNAYVVNDISPAIASLHDGLIVRFIPANANASSTPTLNVASTGAFPITLLSGVALAVTDLSATMAICMWDAHSSSWILLNPQFSSVTNWNVSNGTYFFSTDSGVAMNAYQANIGYPQTDIDGLLPAQIVILSNINFTNNGASTLSLNGSANTPIVLPNGAALNGGELIAGFMYLFVFDQQNNNWVLMNSSSSVTPIEIQSQAFTFSEDSSVTPNAVVLALSPAISVPQTTVNVSFRCANTNTDATTIDMGFGAVAVVTNKGALVGGELLANAIYEGIYTEDNGNFLLINSSLYVSSPELQRLAFTSSIDNGAVNAYVGTYSPSFSIAPTDGTILTLTSLSATNTGDSTFDAGFGAVAIKDNAINPLSGGEMLLNGDYNLQYSINNAAWILLNSSIPKFPATNTWTPVITASGTNPDSITYALQNGMYQQIGNMVFYQLRVILSAITIGAGSGQLQISSPPITAINTVGADCVSSALVQNTTIDPGNLYIVGFIAHNTQIFNLFENDAISGAADTMAIGNLSSTSDITLTGFYFSA